MCANRDAMLPCASGTHNDMSVAPQLVNTARTPPRSNVYMKTPSPTHSSVKWPLLTPMANLRFPDPHKFENAATAHLCAPNPTSEPPLAPTVAAGMRFVSPSRRQSRLSAINRLPHTSLVQQLPLQRHRCSTAGY